MRRGSAPFRFVGESEPHMYTPHTTLWERESATCPPRQLQSPATSGSKARLTAIGGEHGWALEVWHRVGVDAGKAGGECGVRTQDAAVRGIYIRARAPSKLRVLTPMQQTMMIRQNAAPACVSELSKGVPVLQRQSDFGTKQSVRREPGGRPSRN